LIKRRGIIFDFSPRGTCSESDDENPDDYSFLPFSSPSCDLQLTTIPAATNVLPYQYMPNMVNPSWTGREAGDCCHNQDGI
jgi:hypothetical protein